jgi:hypothetical protein
MSALREQGSSHGEGPLPADATAPREGLLGGPWRKRSLVLWAVLAGWAAVLWLWPPAYLAFTVDDAFYYLQIARNLAEGHGVTFDRLQPTNGFHPLWLFVTTPFGWLSGDAFPVLVVLTFTLVLVAGGLDLLGRALAPLMPRLELAAGVLLLNPYAFKVLVNGQESALLFFLLCTATALVVVEGQAAPPVEIEGSTEAGDGEDRGSPAGVERPASVGGGQWLTLPLLGAAVALTRLEGLMFGAVLVLLPVLWPASHQASAWRERISRVALGGLAFATPVVAWAAFSALRFGHPLPVSAAVKAEWYGATGARVGSGVVLAALATVAALVAARRFAPGRAVPVLRALLPLFAYAATVAAVHWTVRGTFLVTTIWYLVPFLLLAFVGVAALVAVAEAGPARWRRAAQGALGLAALAHLALGVAAWAHRLDPVSYSSYQAAQRTGVWLRENTEPDAVLAGWDVGILAWHAQRRLMNLEGLVASWEYKQVYLDERRVEELVRWVEPVEYLVQPFWVGWLERAPALRFWGVEVGEWGVVRADCVPFRPALPRATAELRVHLVLEPPGGAAARLADLAPEADLCPQLPE